MRPPNMLQMRSWINSTLTCEASIMEPGPDVWDDDLGVYVPGPPVTVWQGRCLVYPQSLDGRRVDAGGTQWQINKYVVVFPAGTDVGLSQTVTVTSSPDEPDLTTFDLVLVDVPVDAWAVARQCLAEQVTHP